jgi:mRNA interferase MazF
MIKNSIVLVPFPFDDFVASDLLIEKNTELWTGTGLTVNSVIRLHKMVSIPKSLIKWKLGVININVQKVIAKKLIQLFENE